MNALWRKTRGLRCMLRWLAEVLLFVLAGCGQGDLASAGPDNVVTIAGHAWHVELATTPQQRYRGLSDRRQLADDHGMLFVFDEPEELAFCMRGCYIDLDIAFIDSDLRVVNVVTMYTEPDRVGRKTYRSAAPAMYALEAPAGTMLRAGIKPGDRVTLPQGLARPDQASQP